MFPSYFLGAFVSIAVNLALLLALADAATAPPVYMFGDSTLDVGTNANILNCGARADVPFNGIDFPFSVPTGRFSNGLNTADQIVRLLGGRKSPPPFLHLVKNPSTFKRNILRGVNFASGGSGIINTTGLQFNKVISLKDQIEQFSTVRSNITKMTGSEAATSKILSKAFFLVSTGSNDIFEFYLHLTQPRMSQPEFNATLISTYECHLKTLYKLGARIFGVLGLPPIGCTPFARTVFSNGTCFGQAEETALWFNSQVNTTLINLSLKAKDLKYALGNTHLMTITMMEDMFAFGFKNITSACCGNGTLACNQTVGSVCSNRDEFLFWDRFHPSQRVSELAALTLFGASEPLVTPMNFSQLLGVNM